MLQVLGHHVYVLLGVYEIVIAVSSKYVHGSNGASTSR